jgi:hypothetical protein
MPKEIIPLKSFLNMNQMVFFFLHISHIFLTKFMIKVFSQSTKLPNKPVWREYKILYYVRIKSLTIFF